MSAATCAEQATIAVAASVRPLALEIAAQLATDTEHDYRVVSGATGKLYAQIRHGAPFDVLMAADLERPERLVAEGFASAAHLQVYAHGRLALWRPGSSAPPTLAALSRDAGEKLAIANPRIAPYGAATEVLLKRQSLWRPLAPRLVRADNIGGVHGLVATGAVPAGIVALSTLRAAGIQPDAYALLPADSHPAIEHGMAVIGGGAANPAVKAWLSAVRRIQADAWFDDWGFDAPLGAQRREARR